MAGCPVAAFQLAPVTRAPPRTNGMRRRYRWVALDRRAWGPCARSWRSSPVGARRATAMFGAPPPRAPGGSNRLPGFQVRRPIGTAGATSLPDPGSLGRPPPPTHSRGASPRNGACSPNRESRPEPARLAPSRGAGRSFSRRAAQGPPSPGSPWTSGRSLLPAPQPTLPCAPQFRVNTGRSAQRRSSAGCAPNIHPPPTLAENSP